MHRVHALSRRDTPCVSRQPNARVIIEALVQGATYGNGRAVGLSELGDALVAGLALGIGGCKRNDSGHVDAGVGRADCRQGRSRQRVHSVRAFPDQKSDGSSPAPEFSRRWSAPRTSTTGPLQRKGRHRGQQLTLSDDGKTLRYPFVEVAKEYTLIVRRTCWPPTAAARHELRQKVFSGELKPVAGFASQAACCRHAKAVPAGGVGQREGSGRGVLRAARNCPGFFSCAPSGGRRGSELGQRMQDKTRCRSC